MHSNETPYFPQPPEKATRTSKRDKREKNDRKPTESRHEPGGREEGMRDQWRQTRSYFVFFWGEAGRNLPFVWLWRRTGILRCRRVCLPGVGSVRRTRILDFLPRWSFLGWSFCLSPWARIDNGLGLLISRCENVNVCDQWWDLLHEIILSDPSLKSIMWINVENYQLPVFKYRTMRPSTDIHTHSNNMRKVSPAAPKNQSERSFTKQ